MARILVIEDDASVAALLFELLERSGCQVNVFNSPADAISNLKKGKTKYDVVVSDQTMPGIAGTEFAQELYCLEPDIPVILYSATDLEMGRCPANVRHVLQKPIDNDRLIDLISGLFTRR